MGSALEPPRGWRDRHPLSSDAAVRVLTVEARWLPLSRPTTLPLPRPTTLRSMRRCLDPFASAPPPPSSPPPSPPSPSAPPPPPSPARAPTRRKGRRRWRRRWRRPRSHVSTAARPSRPAPPPACGRWQRGGAGAEEKGDVAAPVAADQHRRRDASSDIAGDVGRISVGSSSGGAAAAARTNSGWTGAPSCAARSWGVGWRTCSPRAASGSARSACARRRRGRRRGRRRRRRWRAGTARRAQRRWHVSVHPREHHEGARRGREREEADARRHQREDAHGRRRRRAAGLAAGQVATSVTVAACRRQHQRSPLRRRSGDAARDPPP